MTSHRLSAAPVPADAGTEPGPGAEPSHETHDTLRAAPGPRLGGAARRLRRTAVALAAAAVGFSLAACEDISGTETDGPKPKSKAGAHKDAGDDKSDDGSGFESDSDAFTVALDKTASWKNGVKASLSGFGRGTSGEWAFPSGKPYLAFTVTVTNDSKNSLDLTLFDLTCPDGADQVFDSQRGFDGTPDTHVLPGKSQKWKTACVFPESAKNVQIELTPVDLTDSGWYRTAIFTGQVK